MLKKLKTVKDLLKIFEKISFLKDQVGRRHP